MKPKLLVTELWGIGDLAIATPFLRAAAKNYAVTLLAKPFAFELQKRFWPEVNVIPFLAPWTAFEHKYDFLLWPWLSILRLRNQLAAERFDVGISARWDPRDHFLLRMVGAKKRFGFARLQSEKFLTDTLLLPEPTAHRYEFWRKMANALGLELPTKDQLEFPRENSSQRILIHSGAARTVRVWPLVRFKNVVRRLREMDLDVQVGCDPNQRQWWLDSGEEKIATPETVSELLKIIEQAGLFIGNDSGPGHLAAICGLPTFTIFGPQLTEWFAPLHPQAEVVEGKACPYKPCSDYCRFPAPHCLLNVSEAEVWARVESFAARHLGKERIISVV